MQSTMAKNRRFVLSRTGRAMGLGLVLLVGTAVRAQSVQPAQVQAAIDFFVEAANEPAKAPFVIAGLRSTKDPATLPIFEGLMRHDDKEIRLMATAAVADAVGESAGPALRERMNDDPRMDIRIEAMLQLAELNLATREELLTAAQWEEQSAQMLAARALVRLGHKDDALPILRELAESKDVLAEALARMSLVGLGDTGQVARLREIIVDPKTDPELLMRLANQIRQEKIRTALPVAEYLAGPEQLIPVRLRAFLAVDELAADAPDQIAKAVAESDSTLLRINLIRLLSQRQDGLARLQPIAGGDDTAAVVARFELARRSSIDEGRAATAALLELGHPVVVEYVLNAFAEAVHEQKSPTEVYVQPVLTYVRAQDLSSRRLTAEHDRAALAVELLCDSGSPVAQAGLAEILAGQSNTTLKQLTAGALYRAEGPAAETLVTPLLQSAFPELRAYAALLLAKRGKPAAAAELIDIQANVQTRGTDILTLANWYLLKLSGRPETAAVDIAKKIQ
jgi:hypothetical protein